MYPCNDEARDENESITHDSKYKERREEVSGCDQGVSDKEANRETESSSLLELKECSLAGGTLQTGKPPRIVYKCW